MTIAVEKSCPCKEKFLFKPESSLFTYLVINCNWDRGINESFTINDVVFSLLIYLYKSGSFTPPNLILPGAELSQILGKKVTILTLLRGLIRKHIVGRKRPDRGRTPFICTGKWYEDIRAITGSGRFVTFLCNDSKNEKLELIGLTQLQLRKFCEQTDEV